MFANASLLLGDWASMLELRLIPDYRGFLLIILPPGGFFVLGGWLLLFNWYRQRRERKLMEQQGVTARGS